MPLTAADQPILVTGAAGFIGFHVAHRLLVGGCSVVGVDNLNDYYDPALKNARLADLAKFDNFRFIKMDIADRDAMSAMFTKEKFEYIVHLAAQVGVRYSFANPQAYVDSNFQGFLNLLEGCRHHSCKHLIYASSSSVYGANQVPFSTSDNVDHPMSLYAASKKANELMAYSYSHLFKIPATGLRFFTVYGPWGRPEMAVYLFTAAIIEGRPIQLFNSGKMRRDFTYVDDVVEAIHRLIERPPAADARGAPWRLYNIGNNKPTEVTDLVAIIEAATGKTAQRQNLPMQPGDAPETYADVSDLAAAVGFAPNTPLDEGIRRFVAWYRSYHAIK